MSMLSVDLLRPSRLLALLTVFITATTANPYYALDSSQGLSSCHAVDPNLPEDWLCPSKTDICISLHKSTAAYCCPVGQNCNRIQPMTCEAVTNPSNNVFLPAINGSSRIRSCSEVLFQACCPWGYHCLDPLVNKQPWTCRINGDEAYSPRKQSAPEASYSVVGMLSSTASTSTTLVSSTMAASSASGSPEGNDSRHEGHSKDSQRATIIAGATIGAAVGIIAIVLGVMIYLRYICRASRHGHKEEIESKSKEAELQVWSYDGLVDVPGISRSGRSSDASTVVAEA